MALDESHRRELFDALDTALGPRPAATLMAHLPPVGWADVATKHDLHELERRIDGRFEQVDLRFERMEERIEHRFTQVEHRFAAVEQRFTALEQRFDDRLHAVDDRLDAGLNRFASELRSEMIAQTRALFLGVAAMTFTSAGLAFVAARLAA